MNTLQAHLDEQIQMKTTPEQFKDEMQNLRETMGGDSEAAHLAMDNAMCRVLVELGYRDGVALFDKQDKWYS